MTNKTDEALEALCSIENHVRDMELSCDAVEDWFDTISQALQANQRGAINHNGVLYWPDENGWYDIACCPKNNDLYSEEPINFLATDGDFVKVCAYDGDLLGWPHVIAPTHWQPLPEPPNSVE